MIDPDETIALSSHERELMGTDDHEIRIWDELPRPVTGEVALRVFDLRTRRLMEGMTEDREPHAQT